MPEIKRTVSVNASPEQVYDWISQAKPMQKWFADVVSRDGTKLTFTWNQQDGGTVSFGADITVDDAPTAFAYKSIEDKPTTTRFDLVADGDNTEVTLTEGPFDDDEASQANMQEHDMGWQFFLSRLQQLAG